MAALRPGARGEIIDAIDNIAGLAVDGDVVFGLDETYTVTVIGQATLRQVDDAGMVASPGTEGELVFNLNDSLIYVCTATNAVAATWVVARLCGAMRVIGNTTVGTTADVAGDTELQTDLAVTQDAAIVGNLAVHADVTLGDAAADTATCNGRLILRTLASDPAVLAPGGTTGEVGYYGGIVYVCQDGTLGAEVWDPAN
jgi:hypothetical protein